MALPDLTRTPAYYRGYINLVKQDDLNEALKAHMNDTMSFLEKIPKEKWDHRYAEGKWSVKEVVQHVLDNERVFAYRALCFARKDPSELPGYDENLYALNAKAGKRDPNDLIEEMKTVIRSTQLLFGSFDEEQLEASGIANEKSVYVRSLGYIIAGHAIHHMNVIRERYL